jgi:hypothetical protein
LPDGENVNLDGRSAWVIGRVAFDLTFDRSNPTYFGLDIHHPGTVSFHQGLGRIAYEVGLASLMRFAPDGFECFD